MSTFHHLKYTINEQRGTFVSHWLFDLGVTDVVDECPIFSNLLRGHLLLFPGTRLIVVQ